MQVMYIAGPYRAKTIHGILENIRAAEQVAIKVWQVGAYALCPHLNTSFFDGLVADRVFLEGTMEMLKRCDGIVLVPGWQHSKGSIAEVRWAMDNDKPVYSTAHNWKHNTPLSKENIQELMDIWDA